MTIKVKLAAIAKDEAAYIPQWVHHHLAFGFDEIEIWLNNTTDNSVELLSKLQMHHPDGAVKFKIADKLLQKCLSENLQFQQLAYAEIYQDALNKSDFTHILFLDLDEFWVPADFATSIKDFIITSPDADAVSFQWMIDTPDNHRHIFSSPFSYTNRLQKNRHVKTLTKITERMIELSVHNHIIQDGRYVLADGSKFPGNERETLKYSLVPTSHQRDNAQHLERAFILHQINRTPVEYLSSLLRGRGHKNDNNVFKTNRIGYILDSHSAPPMEFHVDIQRICDYCQSLTNYLTRISDELFIAQRFIIERFKSAVNILRDTSSHVTTYRDQIRGVKINDLLEKPVSFAQVFFSVDKSWSSPAGTVIEGWAFDALSNRQISISALSTYGDDLQADVFRNERPDVQKVYPDAQQLCGFKVTIPKTTREIKLSFRSSSTANPTVIEVPLSTEALGE